MGPGAWDGRGGGGREGAGRPGAAAAPWSRMLKFLLVNRGVILVQCHDIVSITKLNILNRLPACRGRRRCGRPAAYVLGRGELLGHQGFN